MRTRVTYGIVSADCIRLSEKVDIEDIRLIVNETKKEVLCSSMQKEGVIKIEHVIDDASGKEEEFSLIYIDTRICTISVDDKLTIEIDRAEKAALQGENQDATNSKILEEIGNVATALTAINDTLGTL
jgi:hypothetical protein